MKHGFSNASESVTQFSVGDTIVLYAAYDDINVGTATLTDIEPTSNPGFTGESASSPVDSFFGTTRQSCGSYCLLWWS